MITKNSVILAEPIVLSEQKPLLANASDIVKGLNELSHGALPYTERYRDEIVEVTSDNGHTDLMEQVSTNLAESIRSTFSQISEFGVGFASVLSEQLRCYSTRDRVVDDATGNLSIRFVNLDNDFLVSTLYPTGPKNTNFEYTSINLSVLDRLKFNTDMCKELAETYIDSQHPDITKVMNDPDCYSDEAFYNVFDIDCLKELFHTSGDNFNFQNIKSFRLPLLFKMYVILSKMYASDDPIKALVGGTLTDYREYVSLLWNGLGAYLAAVKQRVNIFRARGIAIHHTKPVTLRTAKRTFDLTNATLEFSELDGDVVVFYTKPVVDTLTQNNYCLRDWVIGRVLCDLSGKPGVDDAALMSGNVLEDVLSDFYHNISSKMQDKQRDVCEFLFQRAVNTFINGNENLRAHVNGLEDEDYDGSAIVVARMNEQFKCGHNLAVRIQTHPEMSELDVVMGSGVVTRFLDAIECHLAAKILRETEHRAPTDDPIEKRKRLHYAVTKVLAEKLLG